MILPHHAHLDHHPCFFGFTGRLLLFRLQQRRYDIEVPLRVEGRTHATLDRDGARLLAWDVQDLDIAGPSPERNNLPGR